MKAAYIRHITVAEATARLRMPASMRVVILSPIENFKTWSINVKFLSKADLLFMKPLE